MLSYSFRYLNEGKEQKKVNFLSQCLDSFCLVVPETVRKKNSNMHQPPPNEFVTNCIRPWIKVLLTKTKNSSKFNYSILKDSFLPAWLNALCMLLIEYVCFLTYQWIGSNSLFTFCATARSAGLLSCYF